ncbi:type II toxin-antitoxin system HicA family toxin [Photorhabdus noenieputensis]|uniref:type II toxin-antitoxin system HicA family toxin n=1 Tax=Photorhabdus noenieputensis TaxID=1208607 RepID=UPI001BD5AF60|nr:type II toxin-antitoxin system HicA family toxin [Photorhabdus noenieputensis]MBS9438166.1 type II toxin-antitoxin system HicA family toxin [Photorhabdus noenieputensis]MCK3670267.1 type II toxin-antitoxin system HicA family toxin [Photorhabdus noenieputensis]
MRSTDLIKEVEKRGGLVRINGSHHHFKHPGRNDLLTIPHPKQEIKVGLLRKIQKQVGL